MMRSKHNERTGLRLISCLFVFAFFQNGLAAQFGLYPNVLGEREAADIRERKRTDYPIDFNYEPITSVTNKKVLDMILSRSKWNFVSGDHPLLGILATPKFNVFVGVEQIFDRTLIPLLKQKQMSNFSQSENSFRKAWPFVIMDAFTEELLLHWSPETIIDHLSKLFKKKSDTPTEFDWEQSISKFANYLTPNSMMIVLKSGCALEKSSGIDYSPFLLKKIKLHIYQFEACPKEENTIERLAWKTSGAMYKIANFANSINLEDFEKILNFNKNLYSGYLYSIVFTRTVTAQKNAFEFALDSEKKELYVEVMGSAEITVNGKRKQTPLLNTLDTAEYKVYQLTKPGEDLYEIQINPGPKSCHLRITVVDGLLFDAGFSSVPSNKISMMYPSPLAGIPQTIMVSSIYSKFLKDLRIMKIELVNMIAEKTNNIIARGIATSCQASGSADAIATIDPVSDSEEDFLVLIEADLPNSGKIQRYVTHAFSFLKPEDAKPFIRVFPPLVDSTFGMELKLDCDVISAVAYVPYFNNSDGKTKLSQEPMSSSSVFGITLKNFRPEQLNGASCMIETVHNVYSEPIAVFSEISQDCSIRGDRFPEVYKNPSHPAVSQGKKTCVIDISLPRDSPYVQLRVDFEQFVLPVRKHGECQTAFIVSEVPGTKVPLNPKWCGDNTGQHFYVFFDSTSNEKKFLASILENAGVWAIRFTPITQKDDLFANPQCAQTYKLSGTVTITSPNFSPTKDVYPKGLDYKICIRGKTNGRHQVFPESTHGFMLPVNIEQQYSGVGPESCDSVCISPEAENDYLSIYNFTSSGEAVVTKYCGGQLNPLSGSIFSAPIDVFPGKDDLVILHFVTDNKFSLVTNVGFQLTVTELADFSTYLPEVCPTVDTSIFDSSVIFSDMGLKVLQIQCYGDLVTATKLSQYKYECIGKKWPEFIPCNYCSNTLPVFDEETIELTDQIKDISPVGTILTFKCKENLMNEDGNIVQKVECSEKHGGWFPKSLQSCRYCAKPPPGAADIDMTTDNVMMGDRKSMGTLMIYKCPPFRITEDGLAVQESACSNRGWVPDTIMPCSRHVRCFSQSWPREGATMKIQVIHTNNIVMYVCNRGLRTKSGVTVQSSVCTSSGQWTPDIIEPCDGKPIKAVVPLPYLNFSM